MQLSLAERNWENNLSMIHDFHSRKVTKESQLLIRWTSYLGLSTRLGWAVDRGLCLLLVIPLSPLYQQCKVVASLLIDMALHPAGNLKQSIFCCPHTSVSLWPREFKFLLSIPPAFPARTLSGSQGGLGLVVPLPPAAENTPLTRSGSLTLQSPSLDAPVAGSPEA